jgi:hypothetical protein
MRGRLRRACATRRRSTAVRRLIPARQDSQCAHERIPSPAQPPRWSNSPSSWRNRASAAAMCPARPSSSDSSLGVVMACSGVGNGMTDTETSRDSAGVRVQDGIRVRQFLVRSRALATFRGTREREGSCRRCWSSRLRSNRIETSWPWSRYGPGGPTRPAGRPLWRWRVGRAEFLTGRAREAFRGARRKVRQLLGGWPENGYAAGPQDSCVGTRQGPSRRERACPGVGNGRPTDQDIRY